MREFINGEDVVILVGEEHHDGLSKSVIVEYIKYLTQVIGISANDIEWLLEWPKNDNREDDISLALKSTAYNLFGNEPSTIRVKPVKHYRPALEQLTQQGVEIKKIDSDKLVAKEQTEKNIIARNKNFAARITETSNGQKKGGKIKIMPIGLAHIANIKGYTTKNNLLEMLKNQGVTVAVITPVRSLNEYENSAASKIDRFERTKPLDPERILGQGINYFECGNANEMSNKMPQLHSLLCAQLNESRTDKLSRPKRVKNNTSVCAVL